MDRNTSDNKESKKVNVILHENIKKICEDRGIKVSKLEEDINFSVGTISRWRNFMPSFDKVLEVANYFHISTDDMMSEKMDYRFKEFRFIEKLIEKTVKRDVIWIREDYGVSGENRNYKGVELAVENVSYTLDIKRVKDKVYAERSHKLLFLHVQVGSSEGCIMGSTNSMQVPELLIPLNHSALEELLTAISSTPVYGKEIGDFMDSVIKG